MNREELIKSFVTFLPVLHKTLFRGLTDCGITRLQMELLYYLKLEGGKPMNYYGNRMMVSRPNLTVLADKMIDEGFVERITDEKDRRVIILKITEKGNDFLDGEMNKFNQHLLKKISIFSDEDIKRLSELMEETREIFSKLRIED
ncbi:UNVERIFIED_CONTAM: MarR family transcriptional regulator [Acetivibrio alkalicellulosi]